MNCTPQYTIVGDRRHVEPYVFDFTANAKGRWLGKKLIDVLSKEFGGYDLDYWTRAIVCGNIKINNKTTTKDYVIKNGDRLLHRTHRHEPSVVGNISLVGETEDILAVSKPASMPMHPCGAYKHNTLTSILANEPLIHEQPVLSTIHRLDRVTSGLVILAKSNLVASRLSKEIRENSTQKVYLARVRGRFPSSLGHLQALELDELMAPTESAEVLRELSLSRQAQAQAQAVASPSEPALGSSPVAGGGRGEGEESGKRRRVGEGGDSGDFSAKRCKAEETQPCFPSGQSEGHTMDASLHRMGYGYSASGELVVRYPLAVVSHREGIHACDPNGKAALSSFRCLGYNESDDTSLVECKPHTGRTHQLRLHLQLVGNPIANDPCYGGKLFFGDDDRFARACAVVAKLPEERRRAYAEGETPAGGRSIVNLPHLHHLSCGGEEGRSSQESSVEQKEQKKEEEQKKKKSVERRVSSSEKEGGGAEGGVSRVEGESDEAYLVRTCRYCQRTADTLTPDEEALLHCSEIWLHALRYSGKNWTFETSRPVWATDDIFA